MRLSISHPSTRVGSLIAALTCIGNSNRLWVSRCGSGVVTFTPSSWGLAYPQRGRVPDFVFGSFSFVNNFPQCCEQSRLPSIIFPPSTSLSVANLKRLRASAPGLGALLNLDQERRCRLRRSSMSPDRLIGASLPGPAPIQAGRGNILYLATSMGAEPSTNSQQRKAV